MLALDIFLFGVVSLAFYSEISERVCAASRALVLASIGIDMLSELAMTIPC